MRDLDGITVVAVEQAVAAPYATGRLADAGARVIKVERPEGDFARNYDSLVNGQSAYFVWLNRGKQSVRLDLKSGEDRELLDRMIGQADIFVQNLAPGIIGRLGFAIPELRKRHPRLICCSISGYGEDGPYRDQKAYDLLIQAESGLCAINGLPEGPARVGVSVCDIAAGMSAHQAILQALFARERTGQGRAIEVSLFHAMADWMNVPYLQHRYGGVTPGRHGLKHPTIAPYGSFSCSDGKQVLISIQNEREWLRLCRDIIGDTSVVTDPRFATNSARVENRDVLDDIVARALATCDREANIERLMEAGIACGRLSDLPDLLTHPQLRHVTVETEAGPVELLRPPSVVAGETLELGPIPELGRDDAAIRAEFGLPNAAGRTGVA